MNQELAKYDLSGAEIKIVHAGEYLVEGEPPAYALCQKRDALVAVATKLVREGKGNEAVKESYHLFQKCGLNFIGNVEGYDIPSGKANVIICDGFVGNIAVKFCESLGKTIAGWLEEKVSGKLAENEMKAITEGLLKATNAADVSGGGPLWAVNGVACVSHGRSRHMEIARTIEQAKLAVEHDLVDTLKAELAAAREKLKEAGFELFPGS